MAKGKEYNTIPACIDLYNAGKKMEAFKGVARMAIRRIDKADLKAIGLGAELLAGNNDSFYAALKIDKQAAIDRADRLFVRYFINEAGK